MLRILRSIGIRVVELELGRDSRMGMVLNMILKDWLCPLHMVAHEIVRGWHDW